MRGRPSCLLLRRVGLLAAAVALLGPVPALAAGPAPDQAPAQSSGLRPDPPPGVRQQAPAAAPATTTTRRPVYVAPAPAVVTPAVHHAAPKRTVEKRTVAPRPRPKRHVTHPAATFALPRIALPSLTHAAHVRQPRDLDAVLAGIALLLAAVTAGSGARLVSRWNDRAGAA